MRLTLRTLLAFVNDSGLNDKQRTEIKNRVKKSDNAKKLIDHLKVITSDPGIQPLSVDDSRSDFDPNQIAQYLDSTMPNEQVAAYEKKCLASAPLLCEVVNCHSILAKVFRQEDVKVPLGIRQRVYSLAPTNGDIEDEVDDEEYIDGRQVFVPTVSPQAVPSQPSSDNRHGKLSSKVDSSKARTDQHRTTDKTGVDAKQSNFECSAPGEGPENAADEKSLRNGTATQKNVNRFRTNDSRARLIKRVASALGLLLILAIGAGGGFFLAGGELPFLDNGSQDKNTVADKSDANRKKPATTDRESDKDNNKDSEDEANKPLGSDTEGTVDQSGKLDDQPGKKDGQDSAETVQEGESSKGSEGSKSDSLDDEKSKKPNQTDGDKKQDEKQPNGKVEKQPDDEEITPKATKPWENVEPVKPALARIVGAKSLLVYTVDQRQEWKLFGSNSPIEAKTLCKSFEGTQTRFELGECKIQIVGRSEFLLDSIQLNDDVVEDNREQNGQKQDVAEYEDSDANVSTINQLEIRTGTFGLTLPEGPFEIVAANKTIRIQVNRDDTLVWVHVEKVSPERQLGVWENRIGVVHFIVRRGALSIVMNGVTTELSSKQGLEFLTSGEICSGSLVKNPAWYSGLEEQDSLVQLAIDPLLGALDLEQPIAPQLTELTTSLRPEVRSLATRMLSWMGYYEPLVQLLNDDFCRSFWSRAFQGFRTDLLNNRQLVENLGSLLKDDLEESKTLYKLLVGPTEKQLDTGWDQFLVDELSSPTLVNRVLAIGNLQNVVGKSLRFRPEVNSQVRKNSVKLWKTELRRKRIAFKEKFEVPRLDLRKIEAPDSDKPSSDKTPADDDLTEKNKSNVGK